MLTYRIMAIHSSLDSLPLSDVSSLTTSDLLDGDIDNGPLAVVGIKDIFWSESYRPSLVRSLLKQLHEMW